MVHKQLLFNSAAREKVFRGATALADAARVTLDHKSTSVLIEKKQRSAKELKSRRFPIKPLQFGQEQRPVLLGACLPHDRAPVPCLGLARRLAGGPIRQQVVHGERTGMRRVGVRRQHQRRALQDQANPRVPMAVDPPLVALGPAKPSLQLEIIPDRFLPLLPNEQAVQEAEHHRGQAVPDRVLGRLEAIDQPLELLLPLDDVLRPGLERRGPLRDHRDVTSEDLLLLLDFVQAARDASGQSAELLLREPPFF